MRHQVWAFGSTMFKERLSLGSISMEFRSQGWRGAAAVLAAYSHNLEYEHHSKVLGTDNGVLQECKQSPGAASHRVDTQSSVMGVISFVPV